MHSSHLNMGDLINLRNGPPGGGGSLRSQSAPSESSFGQPAPASFGKMPASPMHVPAHPMRVPASPMRVPASPTFGMLAGSPYLSSRPNTVDDMTFRIVSFDNVTPSGVMRPNFNTK